ncbi:MAG: lysophospholipid acyltransferase family protein [Hyphomicrobiaceae bacterium]
MKNEVNNDSEQQTAATFRQRLEYGLLLGVIAMARRLGPDRVSALGARVMRVIGPKLRQNRRAMQNLAIAFPDKSEDERRQIAAAMWANMGRTFAETLVLEQLISDPGRIDIPDLETFRATATSSKPLIGCTLHFGNWEIAIFPMRIYGRDACGVYKPIDNPLIDAWLKKTRMLLFPAGMLGKGERDESNTGQRTARLLIDKVRAGGVLGFVCDHFDKRGEPIPFMGRVSRFTAAPAMIGRHVGSEFFVGRTVRLGDACRFRIDIKYLPLPQTNDKKGDVLALTETIFATYEDWIREYPEQWMWWNTRWVQTEADTGQAKTELAAAAPAGQG